jgi:hypothetical protein
VGPGEHSGCRGGTGRRWHFVLGLVVPVPWSPPIEDLNCTGSTFIMAAPSSDASSAAASSRASPAPRPLLVPLSLPLRAAPGESSACVRPSAASFRPPPLSAHTGRSSHHADKLPYSGSALAVHNCGGHLDLEVSTVAWKFCFDASLQPVVLSILTSFLQFLSVASPVSISVISVS